MLNEHYKQAIRSILVGAATAALLQLIDGLLQLFSQSFIDAVGAGTALLHHANKTRIV